MIDQSKPPLWRVMHTAHNEVADPFDNAALAAYAAELRALADWLVPDEYVPADLDDECPWCDEMAYHVVHERQRLRRLLLAEADRAEAGE